MDRSELVAGYLGQTAMKTADVVASAAGGVLFIDEAYSLAGDQYGTEAVDTLVKEMEDRRDDLVLIVAGYPDPMAVFIAQNPGLSSRFRTTIEFADYTDAELVGIFTGLAERGRLRRDGGRAGAGSRPSWPSPRAGRRSATAGSPATSSRPRSAGTPGGYGTWRRPPWTSSASCCRGPGRPAVRPPPAPNPGPESAPAPAPNPTRTPDPTRRSRPR